jgi:2,3-bisphosphoglycerate-independent phosphoglycerate mutase
MVCGLIKPFQFLMKRPTSEGAHIGLFGYKDYFLGRGPMMLLVLICLI